MVSKEIYVMVMCNTAQAGLVLLDRVVITLHYDTSLKVHHKAVSPHQDTTLVYRIGTKHKGQLLDNRVNTGGSIIVVF
jgi:hypothetical protein